MVDPVIRMNPWARKAGPPRIEKFPGTNREIILGPCPLCTQKGVLLFHTTTTRAYKTRCIKCGATHVIHPKGLDWHQFQQEGGTHIPAGPRRSVGMRTEHIDATKRIRVLKRRQELGNRDYWRNPD